MPAFALIAGPAKSLDIFRCIPLSGLYLIKFKTFCGSTFNTFLPKKLLSLGFGGLDTFWDVFRKLAMEKVSFSRKPNRSAVNRAGNSYSTLSFAFLPINISSANSALGCSTIFTRWAWGLLSTFKSTRRVVASHTAKSARFSGCYVAWRSIKLFSAMFAGEKFAFSHNGDQ